jgi:signal transduction histidine kinase
VIIAIVDDIAINRKLLRVTLEAEGHTTLEAADGVEALQILNREKVDVVISDILMPRMDGYRLCHEIRADERLRDTPIVIYTATYTTSADEKLAFDVGADKYLRKPAPLPAILDAARQAITAQHLVPGCDSMQEMEVLKEYSDRLVTKLEEKNIELEKRLVERDLAQEAMLKTEARLRQSEKMEAIGRLAGGIAHDFNNLLTVILGHSSLLCESLAGNSAAINQVTEIRLAGERAASLTKQLLAFSRRQLLQTTSVDLNAVVADANRMLSCLFDERIRLAIVCPPGVWPANCDPVEINRALLNLCLNARDAMPDGGTLTIETGNVTLTETDLRNPRPEAGRYVKVAVRDTGTGIPPELLDRIFEPFFTTKTTGKGSGLGLASVLGIVEQSGGHIRCESQLGIGTTFSIFLPAVQETVGAQTGPVERIALLPTGSEVVLLVEDADIVRELTRQILEAHGYLVYTAANGREGLAFCQAHEGPIHLLVSDVEMPEIGGRELAQNILKLRPGTSVLFVSGHTEDVALIHGIGKGLAFLQKPFTASALAQKVRETLDSAGGQTILGDGIGCHRPWTRH